MTGLVFLDNAHWADAEEWFPSIDDYPGPYVSTLASDEPELGDVIYEDDLLPLGWRVASALQSENATYEYRRWERADCIAERARRRGA